MNMLFREYLNLHNKEFCTGCSACVEKCPVSALKLGRDDQGYYVSHFNPDACINCNACEGVCPVLYPRQIIKDRKEEPDLYAVQMSEEDRRYSSSGGFFPAVARLVLSRGGYVTGCRWSDELRAEHVVIADIADLNALRGSKYVQSYMGDTYKAVKQLLKNEKLVLFVGTPCQVAGLNAFLGKDYEKLITIDVLCLYAPSQDYFSSYLKEQYHNGHVTNCNFRDKANGWTSSAMTIETDDGETKSKELRSYDYDLFEKAFVDRLMKSEHCEKCIFPCHQRHGDLTIGDFWEICQLNTSFDDQGTNSVLINSEKGQRIFAEVCQEATRIEKRELKELSGNRIEKHDWTAAHPQYARFQELYLKEGFSRAARECLDNHFDVAILGCYEVRNFGSHLTYFALYHVIKSMGMSVALVGCPADADYQSCGKPEYFKNIPYRSYEMIPQYKDRIDMRAVNNVADKFIIGSDQMWDSTLYEYFGSYGFLDFVFDNKVKLSYATSFGKPDWYGNEEERRKIAFFLSRFDGISVRETSGVKICKNHFHTEAVWALDPVFLCDVDHYRELIKTSTISLPEKYLAAYILDCSPAKLQILREIAGRVQVPLLVLADPNHGYQVQDGAIKAPVKYVEDWLKFLSMATYVVTDSFHGMCVSLIFHKKMIAVRNVRRGAARFDDYGAKLSIQGSIKSTFFDLLNDKNLFEHNDYCSIDALLKTYRDESEIWLKRKLSIDKTSMPLSTYDLISMREDEILADKMQKALSRDVPVAIRESSRIYRVVRFYKQNGLLATTKVVLSKMKHKLS
ncbi:MAG: polysaccharide pyruvyl transferase family protein [Prevotella sp.]